LDVDTLRTRPVPNRNPVFGLSGSNVPPPSLTSTRRGHVDGVPREVEDRLLWTF
jgi:hypothetical protein